MKKRYDCLDCQDFHFVSRTYLFSSMYCSAGQESSAVIGRLYSKYDCTFVILYIQKER